MKRILKIIGIGLFACLGLAIVGALINPSKTPSNSPVTSVAPVGLKGQASTATGVADISIPAATAVPTSVPATEPATEPPTVVAPTPLPAATEQPAATAPPTSAPAVQEVTIAPGSDSINIRSGPDTNFPVVAPLTAGQTAKVIGRVADSTWLQIDQGWVNRGVVIVTGELDQVAIVEAPVVPIAEAPTTAPQVVDAPAPTLAAPVADAPTGGSGGNTDNLVEPSADEHPCPAGLPIKGNRNSGIYHSPGQQAYNRTDPEVCFATPQEAEAANFRAAKR